MAPETMTEKDQFVDVWEREFQTTLKLLKAYPNGKDEFRPAEKSRNARELAWIFIMEEKVCESVTRGSLEFTTPPPPPQVAVSEIVSMYEKTHREVVSKVRAMPLETLNKTVKFPVGPGQMGDVPIRQILWMMVMDSIHHRGQWSVYLRMTGGKVPSIYGPSGDEPWM